LLTLLGWSCGYFLFDLCVILLITTTFVRPQNPFFASGVSQPYG
jgi:hypothetical protein